MPFADVFDYTESGCQKCRHTSVANPNPCGSRNRCVASLPINNETLNRHSQLKTRFFCSAHQCVANLQTQKPTQYPLLSMRYVRKCKYSYKDDITPHIIFQIFTTMMSSAVMESSSGFLAVKSYKARYLTRCDGSKKKHPSYQWSSG